MNLDAPWEPESTRVRSNPRFDEKAWSHERTADRRLGLVACRRGTTVEMQVVPAGPSELSLPYPRLTSLQRQGDRAQSLDEHEYIALLDEAGLCIQKMSLVLGADNQLIISGTTAAKAEAAYVAAALAVMCGRFRKYDGKAAAWSMAVSACGKDASSAKDRKDKAEKWIARLELLSLLSSSTRARGARNA